MPNRHTSPDFDELLTLAEVAQLFKVSLRTVQRYTASGQLETVRLPSGTVRVRRSAVESLIKASA